MISFRCRWKVETLIATVEKKRKGGKNEKRGEIELLREDKREGGTEDEQKRMEKCEEE